MFNKKELISFVRTKVNDGYICIRKSSENQICTHKRQIWAAKERNQVTIAWITLAVRYCQRVFVAEDNLLKTEEAKDITQITETAYAECVEYAVFEYYSW